MLHFVCENAIALVIAAALVTVVVKLGYTLLVLGSRYAY